MTSDPKKMNMGRESKCYDGGETGSWMQANDLFLTV